MSQLIYMTPVTRKTDGRRFYLVAIGGTFTEPAHVSLVDRDEECLCDECGQVLEPGSNVVAIRGVGIFHPEHAPGPGDL